MKRNAFLCAALLAVGCGGGSSKTGPTTTTGVGGDGTTTTTGDGTTAADPQAAFRKGYSNPGGMWMPRQMQAHADVLTKLGLQVDPSQLSNPLLAPLAAVVNVGGCTGSFVSPDGLVVTNHHCVQKPLQFNSTPESNLVENGFLAKTRAEEKFGGPPERILVAQDIKDVTAQVRDGLDAVADPAARALEIEKRAKALIASCEKDRPSIRCEVKSFFRDAEFQLIESLELRDIRLVYVPARSVGNYGGEVDNWNWPRHTGDFAFLRAYVGPDGQPADFSPDNVPFKPKHFLKVSTQGVTGSDLVMVAGYPGVTKRVATASEVHHDVDFYLPAFIEAFKQEYAVVEEMIKVGGETAIKAGVAKQRIQNFLSKNTGVLAGLTPELLARKDEADAKVKAWAAKPGNEAAKAALDKLEGLLAKQFASAKASLAWDGVTSGPKLLRTSGSRLLQTAILLAWMAEERVKPDAERRLGLQERDMPKLVATQKAFLKTFDRTLDRAMFRLALVQALAVPEADRPWLATFVGARKGANITEATIDKALDGLYKGIKIEDEKLRLELLSKGTMKQLKASKDPFIKLAMALWPTIKAKQVEADAMAGELALLGPVYANALRDAMGGEISPDANSTLRVTFGTVRSFKPDSADAKDRPFTVASEIPAKNTGEEPFDAPAKELELIKAKTWGPYAHAALGEVPVDFLSDVDITGGNSGSPTINGKGELVGLAFDGTLAGVASDWVWNGATTRTIHADVRYMLWIMDAVDQADNVLSEMGVTPAL